MTQESRLEKWKKSVDLQAKAEAMFAQWDHDFSTATCICVMASTHLNERKQYANRCASIHRLESAVYRIVSGRQCKWHWRNSKTKYCNYTIWIRFHKTKWVLGHIRGQIVPSWPRAEVESILFVSQMDSVVLFESSATKWRWRANIKVSIKASGLVVSTPIITGRTAKISKSVTARPGTQNID